MKFQLQPVQGHQSTFQPGEQGIRWLGLEALRLDRDEDWRGSFVDQEAALVILGGRCTVAITPPGGEKVEWRGLGSRGDVFSGLPTSVYAPRGSEIAIKAESKVEIAIGKAPASIDLPPAVVRPEDVKVNNVGAANWRRDVRLLIPPGSPLSQRLIVGETINPPGNWSGFPPHKHDEMTPGENVLEEFYLFKAKPADGFGVQLIYGDHCGEAQLVRNNDVTVMVSGYHPTVATPGTTVYYLWMLSGDAKTYDVSIDPSYRWLSNAEAVIREIER